MTTIQQMNPSAAPLSFSRAAADQPGKAAPSTAEAMNPSTLEVLAQAVTSTMIRTDAGTGKSHVELQAQLRAPAISFSEAAATLNGLTNTLRSALGAMLGSHDPMATEQGSEQRAMEAATSGIVTRNSVDLAATHQAADPVTGLDADLGKRPVPGHIGFAGSTLVNLMILMRQLLLEFENMERENSSDMIVRQLEATERSGQKMVESAEENRIGAIGSTLVTGAVGVAALKQSYTGTKTQTNSTVGNLNSANEVSVSSANSHNALKSNPLPSGEVRAARNLDGTSVPRTEGVGQAAADVRDDVAGSTSATRAVANESISRPDADIYRAAHERELQRASRNMANAAALNMVATQTGGIFTSSMQVESAFTESERQMLQFVAETLKRIADGHQTQVANTRDLRQSTAQLAESLLNQNASTADHIIRHF